MKHLLQIAAISAALTACSMGTGILPAGPDTYTVTERRAPVLGGSTTAQQAAMTEANAFCAQREGNSSLSTWSLLPAPTLTGRLGIQ